MRVHEKVGQILSQNPATRSDDKLLIREFMKSFYGWGGAVSKEKFINLGPSFESITRSRRKRQAGGRYEATPQSQEIRSDEFDYYYANA